LLKQALAGLDETYVAILLTGLQTCTEEEIAAEPGCTKAFVRTRLIHIRDSLRHLSDENATQRQKTTLCAAQGHGNPASDSRDEESPQEHTRAMPIPVARGWVCYREAISLSLRVTPCLLSRDRRWTMNRQAKARSSRNSDQG
jgi:hypothetical protein